MAIIFLFWRRAWLIKSLSSQLSFLLGLLQLFYRIKIKYKLKPSKWQQSHSKPCFCHVYHASQWIRLSTTQNSNYRKSKHYGQKFLQIYYLRTSLPTTYVQWSCHANLRVLTRDILATKRHQILCWAKNFPGNKTCS